MKNLASVYRGQALSPHGIEKMWGGPARSTSKHAGVLAGAARAGAPKRGLRRAGARPVGPAAGRASSWARPFKIASAELSKLPVSQLVVVATDWRRCPLMASDAAERALLRISRNNPRTERSAALASRDSPVAVLQFLRLVRESAHPHRRLFFEADKMIEWLAEVLTTEEIRRLKRFVG